MVKSHAHDHTEFRNFSQACLRKEAGSVSGVLLQGPRDHQLPHPGSRISMGRRLRAGKRRAVDERRWQQGKEGPSPTCARGPAVSQICVPHRRSKCQGGAGLCSRQLLAGVGWAPRSGPGPKPRRWDVKNRAKPRPDQGPGARNGLGLTVPATSGGLGGSKVCPTSWPASEGNSH